MAIRAEALAVELKLEAVESQQAAEASLEAAVQTLKGVLDAIVNSPAFLGKGLSEQQRALLEEVVERYESLIARGVTDPQLQLGLARTLRNLAVTNIPVNEIDQAEQQSLRSLRLLEELPKSEEQRFERARALVTLAHVYEEQHRHVDGRSATSEAIDIVEQLIEELGLSDAYQLANASMFQSMGDLSYNLKEDNWYRDALGWYGAAETIRWPLYNATDPPERIPADLLADVLLKKANMMLANGDRQQARANYEQVVIILTPFQDTAMDVEVDPAQRITRPMRFKLAIARRSYAMLVKPADRLSELEASLLIIRTVVEDSPDTTEYQIELARSLLELAQLNVLTPGQQSNDPQAQRIDGERRQKTFDELIYEVLPPLSHRLPTNVEVRDLVAQAQAALAQFQGIETQ